MIKESYVSFETAMLLKEKGFNEDEDCLKRYSLVNVKGWRGDTIVDISKNDRYLKTEIDITDSINCPTQQMVMRWLREVHHIHISIEMGFDVDNSQHFFYMPSICKFSNKNGEYSTPFGEEEFDTYEEACEAALKYTLENLI